MTLPQDMIEVTSLSSGQWSGSPTQPRRVHRSAPHILHSCSGGSGAEALIELEEPLAEQLGGARREEQGVEGALGLGELELRGLDGGLGGGVGVEQFLERVLGEVHHHEGPGQGEEGLQLDEQSLPPFVRALLQETRHSLQPLQSRNTYFEIRIRQGHFDRQWAGI